MKSEIVDDQREDEEFDEIEDDLDEGQALGLCEALGEVQILEEKERLGFWDSLEEVYIPNIREKLDYLVEQIFLKPGSKWTGIDRYIIVIKFLTGAMLPRIYLFAADNLGSDNPEDAENVWDRFCSYWSEKHSREISRLSAVMRIYDPNKEKSLPFFEYLKYCFANFCYDEGEILRKLARIEVRFPTMVDENGEEFEIEFATEENEFSPEASLLKKEKIQDDKLRGERFWAEVVR